MHVELGVGLKERRADVVACPGGEGETALIGVQVIELALFTQERAKGSVRSTRRVVSSSVESGRRSVVVYYAPCGTASERRNNEG